MTPEVKFSILYVLFHYNCPATLNMLSRTIVLRFLNFYSPGVTLVDYRYRGDGTLTNNANQMILI